MVPRWGTRPPEVMGLYRCGVGRWTVCAHQHGARASRTRRLLTVVTRLEHICKEIQQEAKPPDPALLDLQAAVRNRGTWVREGVALDRHR